MTERVKIGPKFGVLTLATRSDFLKAIGLALSLRASNPDVPTAVACHPDLFSELRPFFDYLVEEVKGLRGFAHKVYLDQYSPFEQTLFLDSDVLVFQDLKPHIESWPSQPYTACGVMSSGGLSLFGLDRRSVMMRLGVSEMVCIDGAGHAYFEKPECVAVFDRARYVTSHYKSFAGDAVYADEDAMNIVMTEFALRPAAYGSFFSRYMSAKPGTLDMDVVSSHCEFIAADTGLHTRPCMMHFAADEAPVAYGVQLWRLFRRHGVEPRGLLSMMAGDIYRNKLKPALRRIFRNKAPWVLVLRRKMLGKS